MKRKIRLFENFEERQAPVQQPKPVIENEPAPAPVKETAGDIPFNPNMVAEYSYRDEKDRLVVRADFGAGSLVHKFQPNEGRELMWLVPTDVEEIAYEGRWLFKFKKGVEFEGAWNTLRDHEGTIGITMKRLDSACTWDFIGFSPMNDNVGAPMRQM